MQHNAEKEFRLPLGDITKLIDAGRDKGHPGHNEMTDLIPHDDHSLEDLDDLLAMIGTPGVDVLAGQPEFPSLTLQEKFEEEVEAGEFDLSPNTLEKTDDPMRMYLREMGTVPLLTREGGSGHCQVHRARSAERAEGAFTLALCDPTNPGHW
jgi:hypothetical protein